MIQVLVNSVLVLCVCVHLLRMRLLCTCLCQKTRVKRLESRIYNRSRDNELRLAAWAVASCALRRLKL
jgi:hypothetical protein